MRKIRLIIGCVTALVALTAVSVSSASAAEWFVNGAALTGSTEISPTTKTVKNAVLSGGGETVECTGLTGKEAFITAKTSGKAAELTFTGCASTTAECTISSSEIKTNPVTTETATVSGTETKTVFKTTNPENIFAKIKFAVGCPVAGNLNVKGEKLTVTSPKGATEATEQEIVVNSTTELKLGANPATLKGASLLKLTSGLKWSFH
jgi:hypothetical protein